MCSLLSYRYRSLKGHLISPAKTTVARPRALGSSSTIHDASSNPKKGLTFTHTCMHTSAYAHAHALTLTIGLTTTPTLALTPTPALTL